MTTIIIVAGVSGCGKSTIGALLAGRTGWPFTDGDSFHPPANIAKMAGGLALTDEDRRPWLNAICDWLDQEIGAGQSDVLACSALKRAYRDELVHGRPEVTIAMLVISQDVVRRRLTARHGHFFNPDLLSSQFGDLEMPRPDETSVIAVPASDRPEQTADEIMRRLGIESQASRSSGKQAGRRDV
jgi:gluconokinase